MQCVTGVIPGCIQFGPYDCRLPIEWSPGEGLTTGMLTPK